MEISQNFGAFPEYMNFNHLNDLYVLSNKAVGPGEKKSQLINEGPTSIPEARVAMYLNDRYV